MVMKRRRTNTFERWSPGDVPDNPQDDLVEKVEKRGSDHFATRWRANDFVRLLRTLPDPDPILRKMGKSVIALRELLTDSHLESVWSVRCAVTSGAEWFIGAGTDGKREQEAADAFAEALARLDIPRIIEEMMDAVAFGFAPLEVLWQADAGRWDIGDIVGKPTEWFEFTPENRLVFRIGGINTEELPDNRFLLVQHRASYINPYGDKAFSKCFWPVTFKRNGFRWWTVFVEKYGGAFMYGKYPNNAGQAYKTELLDALEKMVSDAVAIAPEGSEITIESLANKGGVSDVHASYIAAANAEVSKAILGQTLTTEIGDKGSYAAAQAHNLVREDLAAADRRQIASAFNRLAAVWTFYNFGADVAAPRFEFVKDEDLQAERAERDTKLFAVGWRPQKAYITREYGMAAEDFDIADGSTKEQGFSGMKSAQHFASSSVPCPCCHGEKHLGLLDKFAVLFASTVEKQAVKDERLMAEFEELMLKAGQDEIDALVENCVDALGTVDGYEAASSALVEQYGKQSLDRFAHLIDEVRYAAQGVGGSRNG
jgi:phage gp29-like protein